MDTKIKISNLQKNTTFFSRSSNFRKLVPGRKVALAWKRKIPSFHKASNDLVDAFLCAMWGESRRTRFSASSYFFFSRLQLGIETWCDVPGSGSGDDRTLIRLCQTS